MNRAGHILFPLLTLLGSAVFSLCADEASERRQGDDAFALEDYAKAADFYRSAMKLADAEKLPDRWADDALHLGRACLFDGDVQGAKAILAEFRKRNPLRSAGTLPAEILIAEGNYADAKKMLEVLRGVAADEKTRQEIRSSYASLLLASGDLPGALREFDAMRKSSPAAPGEGEYLYTLIRMGRCDEALAEMKTTHAAGKERTYRTLRYLACVRKGDLKELRASLDAWMEQETPRPQARILEVLMAAAAAAEKEKDPSFAAKCLLHAEKFTGNEAERRTVLHRYINAEADRSPEAVAQAARRYATDFPRAADRASLQVNVANLLVQKGKSAEAEKLFLTVIEDESLPLAERTAAAEAALPVTEKNRNIPLTAKLYEFLASRAQDPAEKVRRYRAYADFLRRWEDDDGAAEQLKKALNCSVSAAENNALSLALLEICGEKGNTPEVRRLAALLLAGKDPECSAVAHYELGRAAEKEKKWSEARDHYRKSAAFTRVKRTFMPSRFSAAMMTRALGEHQEAGKEFLAFSRDFPKTPEASQTLFLAAQEFRKAGDRQQEKRCTEQLAKEYPDSEARAAAVLQTVWERAEEDLPGTIAELEEMEKEFAKQPAIWQEITLERARLLAKKGDHKSALECVEKILHDPNSRTYPEGALLKGNLLFRTGDFAGAQNAYRQAAASHEAGLFQDAANGRVIDCEIMQSKGSDQKILKSAAAHCEELIRTSRFPAIRLQSRCKLGTIQERLGNSDEAVRAYEGAIYEARSMADRGISPDPQWCIRAVENGIRLLSAFPPREALRRGSRLLDNAATLPLAGSGLDIPAMKQEFRQKISSR